MNKIITMIAVSIALLSTTACGKEEPTANTKIEQPQNMTHEEKVKLNERIMENARKTTNKSDTTLTFELP